MGVGYNHFAMKWQALTFADDHPIKDTLLMWDQVIYHRKIYNDYIERLCLAHVVQVTPKDEFVIDQMQHYKNYDVIKIIEYSTSSSSRSINYIFIIISVVVLIISMYLYLNKQISY